jgi:hypothetical protein
MHVTHTSPTACAASIKHRRDAGRTGTQNDVVTDPDTCTDDGHHGGRDMLLKDKTAIVYGAAGMIGAAVARAYAREGAYVHLAGRNANTLEAIATRIRDDGAAATVAPVDVRHCSTWPSKTSCAP